MSHTDDTSAISRRAALAGAAGGVLAGVALPSSAAARQLDAGLFFICYQRQPGQFDLIQERLAAEDRLNQFISHVGSGVFVCPPGARKGGYVGETLLG